MQRLSLIALMFHEDLKLQFERYLHLPLRSERVHTAIWVLQSSRRSDIRIGHVPDGRIDALPIRVIEKIVSIDAENQAEPFGSFEGFGRREVYQPESRLAHHHA